MITVLLGVGIFTGTGAELTATGFPAFAGVQP